MLPVPINPVVPYRASWTIARAAPVPFASLNRHNEPQRVPNATSRTNLGVQHYSVLDRVKRLVSFLTSRPVRSFGLTHPPYMYMQCLDGEFEYWCYELQSYHTV